MPKTLITCSHEEVLTRAYESALRFRLAMPATLRRYFLHHAIRTEALRLCLIHISFSRSPAPLDRLRAMKYNIDGAYTLIRGLFTSTPLNTTAQRYRLRVAAA